MAKTAYWVLACTATALLAVVLVFGILIVQRLGDVESAATWALADDAELESWCYIDANGRYHTDIRTWRDGRFYPVTWGNFDQAAAERLLGHVGEYYGVDIDLAEMCGTERMEDLGNLPWKRIEP